MYASVSSNLAVPVPETEMPLLMQRIFCGQPPWIKGVAGVLQGWRE
ncbi:hypothetical protein C4K40_0164 [Pseudomonas sp. CMR5c]|nr:hypothetical protein C4K40_0164 [Pseudomonas sp. CMR5c]